MDNNELIKCLNEEISNIQTSHKAIEISKIANKYYKEAPKSDIELLEICELLFASDSMGLFSIATIWIKKRKTIIDIKYFEVIEGWLYNYMHNRGRCDQFCYRVLNPFVDKYPELYENVLKWTNSEKLYVRRAAPVSLIRIGTGIRVKYDLNKLLTVVDTLKNDGELHIQKAIGWLLKYAYQAYPDEIIDYLKTNVETLSRTAFRYALEKVPKKIKEQMMRLDY